MFEEFEKQLQALRDAEAQVFGVDPPYLVPLRTKLLYKMLLLLKMQQRQIEDLRAELRREVAAMNRAINQASPDYGEP